MASDKILPFQDDRKEGESTSAIPVHNQLPNIDGIKIEPMDEFASPNQVVDHIKIHDHEVNWAESVSALQFDKYIKVEANEVSQAEFVISPQFEVDVKLEQNEAGSDGNCLQNECITAYINNNSEQSQPATGQCRPRCKKSHECHVCGKFFPTMARLSRHILAHNRARAFPKSTSKNMLNSSKKIPPKIPLECIVCQMSCNKVGTFNKHMLCHPDFPSNKCGVCGKLCANIQGIKIHLFRHTIGLAHKCSVCGKEFIMKRFLTQHLLSHSTKKKHKCKMCKKYFATNVGLVHHMRVHTEDRPNVCKVCGENFGQWHVPKKHKLTHMKKVRHTCDMCGASFKMKYKLRKHMLIHVKNECSVCGLDFLTRALLLEHKKTYPECLHKCGMCEKVFVDKDKHDHHISMHTRVQMITCHICLQKFSETVMPEHHKLSHKRHNCDVCGKIFVKKHRLMKHKLSHLKKEKKPPPKCGVCGKGYKQKVELTHHMFIHTGDWPFKCGVCGKGYALEFTFNNHVSSHCGPNICSICGKEYVHKNTLSRHMSTHGMPVNSHKMTVNRETQYKCEICGKGFGRQSVFTKHMQTHTNSLIQDMINETNISKEPNDSDFTNIRLGDEQTYVSCVNPNLCQFCEKGFYSHQDLNMHLLTHVKGQLKDCEACVEGFIVEELLQKHVFNHIDSSMYDSCDYVTRVLKKKKLCEQGSGTAKTYGSTHSRKSSVHVKGSARKGTLKKQDLLNRSRKGRYECYVCGKIFKYETYLSAHMLTHTGDWPHKCDVCRKGFTQKGKLAQHMLSHTGERPHKCGVCGKGFKTKGYLSVHALFHVQERSYKCRVCKKHFSTQGHLSKHMLLHIDYRPHLCGVCGQRYKQKGHLSQHMKIHTREQPLFLVKKELTCTLGNKPT